MISTPAQSKAPDTYQDALEAAGIGIWDHDLFSGVIHLAGYSQHLWNVPEGTDLNHDSWLNRIHPADRPNAEAVLSACCIAGGNHTYKAEYRIINPVTEETLRWVRAQGRVSLNEEAIAYRFTGSWQDISEEVRTRETQQKLLALVDNSIELMSILETNQRNSYINKAGMEMLGFDTLEQVYETPISDLHTPEDVAFVQANVVPAVFSKGKWSGVMNVRHLKTGEVFPVFNNTVRIDDPMTGEPMAIGAVMRDIRPEIAAQKALQESERAFRLLVMQAPVGICIFEGSDFTIKLANDSFLELSDMSREQILGRNVSDAFPEAVEQGFLTMLQTVYATGKPHYGRETEVTQIRSEQARRLYVDFTYQPLLDPDGAVSRIMGLAVDVTDKVLARQQLKNNEEELQRRVAERTAELEKKNKELEEFNYITSHDLQEPLRKMKLFREMIQARDYDRLSEFSKEKFDKVGHSLERMTTSIKDLLAYTSLGRQENLEAVDLNEILKGVEVDLELLIDQKGAKIEKDNLPTLMGYRVQMHLLFYNLLNNALKFSRKDAIPHIRIETAPLPSERRDSFPELSRAYNYYEIIVSDNGIGFSQDRADRIFRMFQRLHTRQEYSGTGIGLALCRKAVNNHHGHIYAVSVEGKGASFHILLPTGLR
jgi:hypothetical protein